MAVRVTDILLRGGGGTVTFSDNYTSEFVFQFTKDASNPGGGKLGISLQGPRANLVYQVAIDSYLKDTLDWLLTTTSLSERVTELETTGRLGLTDGGAGAGSSSAVGAHEAASDPHPNYQLESEKNVANGYAGLDASTSLAVAQMPEFVRDQASTGSITFGGFSKTGLNLTVLAGTGWIKKGPPANPAPATLTKVYWNNTVLAVPAHVSRHIVVDKTGTPQLVTGHPDPYIYIILGLVITDATRIVALSHLDVDVVQSVPDLSNYLHRTHGTLLASGMGASATSPAGLGFRVDAGSFYVDKNYKTSLGHNPATFNYWYRNPGAPLGWTVVASHTAVSANNYDDGSGVLAILPATKWRKDVVYASSISDSDVEYHVFYGQEVFDSQAAAELGNLPAPHTDIPAHMLRIAGLVVQQGATQIASLVDVRPRLGQFAPPTTSVTDHGNLLGLGDNDHPQYQLAMEKGQDNGYASLDGNACVPVAQLENLSGREPVVVMSLISDALSAPPGSPKHGDSYIVGAAPSGGWVGFAQGDLVNYNNGIWTLVVAGTAGAPTNGIRAVVNGWAQTIPAGSFLGHSGKIAIRSAGSWIFQAPSNGWNVLCTHTNSSFRNGRFHYDSTAAKWRGTSGDVIFREATADATITNQLVDLAIADMTFTPSGGIWEVQFSSSWSGSFASGFASIWVGGVKVEASERRWVTFSSRTNNFITGIDTSARVMVNGSQAVELRWRTSSTNTMTMYQRQIRFRKID